MGASRSPDPLNCRSPPNNRVRAWLTWKPLSVKSTRPWVCSHRGVCGENRSMALRTCPPPLTWVSAASVRGIRRARFVVASHPAPSEAPPLAPGQRAEIRCTPAPRADVPSHDPADNPAETLPVALPHVTVRRLGGEPLDCKVL